MVSELFMANRNSKSSPTSSLSSSSSTVSIDANPSINLSLLLPSSMSSMMTETGLNQLRGVETSVRDNSKNLFNDWWHWWFNYCT